MLNRSGLSRLTLLGMLCFGSADALAHQADMSILTEWQSLLSPRNEWTLHDRVDHSTMRMPEQRKNIAALPIDKQRRLQEEIRRHDINLSELRQAFSRIRAALNNGNHFAEPEYRANLSEIVIGIDRESRTKGRLLADHEPILRALPDYTEINILTPIGMSVPLRRELKALGLTHNVRVIVDPAHPDQPSTSRWVRDFMLVGSQPRTHSITTPLRYQPHPDLRWNDLQHLQRLRTPDRKIIATPLFYRAGNLLLGINPKGERILFLGNDELRGIVDVYEGAVGFHPPHQSIARLMAAIVGADHFEILPNTQHLFHIDMAMNFIRDGVAVLLTPLDLERVAPEDQKTLGIIRQALQRHGFQTIDVPTVSSRIALYQSPVNVVPFRHRQSGEHMALVPAFPETPQSNGLNLRVLGSYRAAGVQPIPVEDRFYPMGGNTHCAVVALR